MAVFLRGSFLLLFSFCFIIIANGQKLHATKRDSIMLENNIAYARHIDRLMPDSSRLILNKVLDKTKQLGLQKTHFRALLGLTQNFEAEDEYGKSDSLLAIIARSPLVFSDATYHIEYLLRLSHHLELLHLIDSSTLVSERNAELSRANNNYKLDEIYFMAGAANFNSGNYINAIKYYQAALELTDTTNTALQVQYNGYLGMIFLNLGQATESLKYYQRALYFMDKTGQEHSDILYGAGMCYFNLGQNKPAFEYLKRAIENPNEDWTYRFVGANSYLHYWKCAVKLHKENHNEIGMHFINNISKSHFKFEAMQAEILMFYNKLEQAEKILFKGLEKLKENGAAQSMNLSFYALLAELYEKKNDTKKALFYHKLFFALNDSLRNENIQNEIVNLREQFQASRREATINELTNQVKVEKLEASLIKSRMRFTIILVLIGFGLIISTGIFIRYRQKLNIVKLQVENQDKEHEIEKILEQSKTNILSSSLKGQEKERARLAKEFHDNLGSRISALRYFVAAKKGIYKNDDENILKTELKNIQEYIRNLSHQMAKPGLAQINLPQLIEEQEYWTGNSTVDFVFDFDPAIHWHKIPDLHQNQMYRIIQEAITNSLKHSGADKIIVITKNSSSGIKIQVQDNGIGLKNMKTSGIGLKNMKERAEIIGGKLEILPDQQKGTRILLTYQIAG